MPSPLCGQTRPSFALVPLLVSLLCSATPRALAQVATTAPIHGKNGITLPPPPVVPQHTVVDSYSVAGSSTPVQITDPYQWLEDAHSPATRSFITDENAYTAQYFAQVKTLSATEAQLGILMRVDTVDVPIARGDRFFFSRRLASDNQASLYVRTGLHGPDRKLVDGNALSTDGNTSAVLLDVSDDGTVLTYGVRVGGADELTIHFLDVQTGATTLDILPSARYYGVVLAPDKKGVYFSRFFPGVGTRVFFHLFGKPFSTDLVLLDRDFHGQHLTEIDNVSLGSTDNGHFLILNIDYGVPAHREDILVKDLRTAGAPLMPLVYGIESRFDLLSDGDTFFVRTDWKAPNGRILRAHAGQPVDSWPTVIPEGADVLETASLVGHHLFVLRLHDVKSELKSYTLDGKEAATVDLPGIGAGSTLSGRDTDPGGFYTFQSFITPPTIYRYNIATGRSEVFYRESVPFNTDDFEIHQVFFPSKDGTRIPMFIAGRKGLKRDGTERLLMTGYGGFAVSLEPTWNPEYAWWMQQGGWFAMPNLRGGKEYGESWHKAAMFANKQNVFDDWFAAAHYLIDSHYTSPEHFAIRGRSNGGLLMGAAMTEHPELFGAIWCGYPLLDMLRYQNFEMGRTWTTEYGSADNPADFSCLRAYSPYGNVHPGTPYPAILFFTGDGDTRVDPMNARKMTPLMQSASSSGRPILLHYSTKGGHSAGVSQTQLITDYANEMSFLWTETGSR